MGYFIAIPVTLTQQKGKLEGCIRENTDIFPYPCN